MGDDSFSVRFYCFLSQKKLHFILITTFEYRIFELKQKNVKEKTIHKILECMVITDPK